jgi:CheY-like chemotaxis protein
MKVLLVEDDASLREGMGELISELAEVRETGNVPQALVALEEGVYDLVITDLRIGEDGDGGRIILEAARRRLQPVVIVSAATSEEVVRVLRPHEPDAVLAKPFQIDDVLGLVERFLELRREAEGWGAAHGQPAAEGWRETAAGMEMAEVEPGWASWVRMAPGAGLSPQVHRGGGAGVFLLEGELEVEGERRVGPQYFYLAAGPREVTTRTGCLAFLLALRR